MFNGLVYDSSHITGAQIILSVAYQNSKRREERLRNVKKRNDILLGIKPAQIDNSNSENVNVHISDMMNQNDNFFDQNIVKSDDSLILVNKRETIEVIARP